METERSRRIDPASKRLIAVADTVASRVPASISRTASRGPEPTAAGASVRPLGSDQRSMYASPGSPAESSRQYG